MKRLSEEVRNKVRVMLEEGESHSDISKTVGVHKSFVHRVAAVYGSSRGSNRCLLNEKRDAIIRLFENDGLSYREIAEMVGCHIQTVQNTIRMFLGMNAKPIEYNKAAINRETVMKTVHGLMSEGMSIPTIADILHMSVNSVGHIVKLLGGAKVVKETLNNKVRLENEALVSQIRVFLSEDTSRSYTAIAKHFNMKVHKAQYIARKYKLIDPISRKERRAMKSPPQVEELIGHTDDELAAIFDTTVRGRVTLEKDERAVIKKNNMT